MTLGDLKLMLQEDFARYDKEQSGWYTKWINRAIKKICQDRSWNCMRKTTNATIASGFSNVQLPSDFKELQNERPAVFLISSDGSETKAPVSVTSRAYMDEHSQALWPSVSTGSQSHLEAFIEQTSSGSYIFNIDETVDQDVVYRLQYFGFFNDLVNDLESNYITNNYEDMLISKIKEIAFLSVNDPIAADFMALYKNYLQEAWRDDQGRKHSGRKLRMGG